MGGGVNRMEQGRMIGAGVVISRKVIHVSTGHMNKPMVRDNPISRVIEETIVSLLCPMGK